MAALLDHEFHHEDGVLRHDPHEHEQADHHRQVDGRAIATAADGAADRQRQRCQDGQGLQEIPEQQDQHRIHHQHAEGHGDAELLEHFPHVLRVAVLDPAHAGRQLAQGGQGVDGFQRGAQRRSGQVASTEILRSRADRSMRAGPLPYPMSATLRSATVAPLSVETRRLPSACRSPCSSAGSTHGHLPVREVEARRIGIGVAHGGDARHRADRRGGDAARRASSARGRISSSGRGSGSLTCTLARPAARACRVPAHARPATGRRHPRRPG